MSSEIANPRGRARSVVLVVAFTVLAFVISALVLLPAAVLLLFSPAGGRLAVLLGAFALGEVGFAVAGVALLRREGLSTSAVSAAVPTPPQWGAVVAATAGLVGLNYALLEAGVRSGGLGPSGSGVDVGSAAATLAVAAAVMFLVVAPVEEFYFRGVVQRFLRGPFSTHGAILVTSVVFALAHLPGVGVPGADPLSVSAVLFVASVCFGYLYEWSDNLAVPALVHGAYNTVVVGALLL